MSLRTKKCNTKSHAFSFLMLPDYFRTVNVKPTSSQQRYFGGFSIKLAASKAGFSWWET